EVVINYAQQPYVKDSLSAAPAREPDEMDLVLALLLAGTDQDFRHYKRTTLQRRIQRRMGLAQIKTISDYLRFLRDNPEEVRKIGKDLLIGVTSFFREPEAFNTLAEEVVPQLFRSVGQ